MDSSSQDGEGKKKVMEVKTFPVPFALGEKKGNITINEDTPSKPSKEQIIKQALQFHLKGNIPEAAKYYQYFIDQGFNDHRVYSNYGSILRDLGKSQEAELSTRKKLRHLYHRRISSKPISQTKPSSNHLRTNCGQKAKNCSDH